MKKLIIIPIAFLLVVGAGTFYIYTKPKPAIETKFVQDIRQNSETENEKTLAAQVGENELQIKEPTDYALVANPAHTYQTFNNCGPATLSMIFSLYGKKISQNELGDKMRPYQNTNGDNDDKTIFTYEFVDWAREYGLEAVARVNGDINILKKFTANGIPVVVKTWLHPGEDIGHFRIVRGFDENKKVIIQDDSYEGPNKKYSYYDFLSMWQPFNYAYIIVYPGDMKDKVNAILADEADEKKAWENALVRAEKERQLDIKNPYPVFNISTSTFHTGDYEKSVKSFEEIESQLPKRMLWYQIEPIEAYRQLGNYDRVFEVSQRILDNGNRAFSELYQIRGEIYLTQGKNNLAKNEFEQALKYNSNFIKAKESLKGL